MQHTAAVFVVVFVISSVGRLESQRVPALRAGPAPMRQNPGYAEPNSWCSPGQCSHQLLQLLCIPGPALAMQPQVCLSYAMGVDLGSPFGIHLRVWLLRMANAWLSQGGGEAGACLAQHAWHARPRSKVLPSPHLVEVKQSGERLPHEPVTKSSLMQLARPPKCICLGAQLCAQCPDQLQT